MKGTATHQCMTGTISSTQQGKSAQDFYQTALATVRLWWSRYKERLELSSLEDRMLEDIGVSRTEANQESEKAFWME